MNLKQVSQHSVMCVNSIVPSCLLQYKSWSGLRCTILLKGVRLITCDCTHLYNNNARSRYISLYAVNIMDIHGFDEDKE